MLLRKKRGQLAIFVIVALVIVFAVVFFLLLRRGVKLDIEEEFNPQSFVRTCTKQSIQQALEIVMPQGGVIEPSNYKLYNNNKVEYICYGF